MGQLLHSCARTTEATRRAIQQSQESLTVLAARYGINEKTVAKWRGRGFVQDAPMGPKALASTVLTKAEEAVCVAFRQHTLLPLDDCLYALQPTIPHLSRSTLHRCYLGSTQPYIHQKSLAVCMFCLSLLWIATTQGCAAHISQDRESKTATSLIESSISDDDPVDMVALCLSGGGYRAMLFHIGALWRMNELGLLPSLDTISSVSGGSITAGILASRWPKLAFDDNGVASNFVSLVVEPARTLASKTIDVPAILVGVFWFGSANDHLSHYLKKYVFGDATLQDLPDHPRFRILATNLQTGNIWSFSKHLMGEHRHGAVHDPILSLAQAVAASTAFPPLLSPADLHLTDTQFASHSPQLSDEELREYRNNVLLIDGGVFDNLGLEMVQKRHGTLFVSDASGKRKPEPAPWTNWISQLISVTKMISDQPGPMRRRKLLQQFMDGSRKGAYWSTYFWGQLEEGGRIQPTVIKRLAELETRLASLDIKTQEELINWGYLAADSSIRKNFLPNKNRQDIKLPYPASPLIE